MIGAGREHQERIMRLQFFAAAAAFALAACAPPVAEESAETAPPAAIAEAQPEAANCAVRDSRNWTAHINALPDPDAQRILTVNGEVDLPTPGYTITLREGPADRSAQPVQQFALETYAPDGMVAQVITPVQISYSGPALGAYSRIDIMCNGAAIATISDVFEAH